MPKEEFDGRLIKDALLSAESCLEKHVKEINRLNVFPVPDGDTGTNMILTLRAATRTFKGQPCTSAAETTAYAARGALLGARGNSGVILSQILHGLSKGLALKDRFSPLDFARSLRLASESAYGAMATPVEGTMLTVMREVSDRATKAAQEGANLRRLLGEIVAQARESVMRTPELLPRLKEAGVVDAGGKGLLYIFQGMKGSLSPKGGEEGRKEKGSGPPASGGPVAEPEKRSYGFDLQFLIQDSSLPLGSIRHKLQALGESLLVVGDRPMIRVHIHTQDTDAVIAYAHTVGQVQDITIEDMDAQVREVRGNLYNPKI